ncbi:TrkH family potassium uptake protein [bacterium]|nr:TrkH family potassium uptake protein [bacterium]MBU1154110.1 TrkH family potassium uptake protein [bacterium]MBU2599979.1 TrkH family potassium uptake protein [bacterium]
MRESFIDYQLFKKELTPAQILVLSFFVLITIGTILLKLPWAVHGSSLPFIDCLFTATSASCVSGLSVCDIGTRFTYFGQLVILLLMQLGGLGIMTFSSLFVVLLHQRFTFKNRMLVKESLNTLEVESIKDLLKNLFIFTFLVEFLGTLVLYFYWSRSEVKFNPLFCSVFHSISAFCNAGFSLFTDNLMSYQESWLINLTITSLIIIGGLGFFTISNLKDFYKGKEDKKIKIISLQAKIVISFTIFLIFFSTLVIFILESNHAFLDFSLIDKLKAAYFHAIVPRTAGFNTVNVATFTSASLFFMIILMFIGGGSGSTAGGIKVNTLGVVYGIIKSIFKGRDEIELFYRTIPRNIGYKAILILILSILVVIIGTISLLILESGRGDDFSFLNILFEVVSAFGTVGLSVGITSKLSFLSKVVTIFLMFIGRLGPLTLALAIKEERLKAEYHYPEERVSVG